ncbi:beta-lactamase/transpeptidase-like protein [Lophiotrema nucula]|uniref:Beta-lactamase/transpeptidase-like protein n=1 Tax=Lophiotrema nucula TaxID=690887 RepID=A0A6A5YHV1_9PLEO|nr:beta-lactamase/transpeptidase-like protein [Lophiotrema nucula]
MEKQQGPSTNMIASRFIAARPTIQKILSSAGTVGLSYGVLHHGEVVHVDNFGYRDHAQKIPMTEETMMPICSMTKGLVSSALGFLVEEGKLEWDTRVAELLPEFASRSQTLKESATLTDFLSMRSGIERYNIWTQSDNRIDFAKSDGMKIINSLGTVFDLRADFAYNNWGYKIATRVCDKVTGQSWDSYLHEKVFRPLGLRRTDASGDREGFDNVARSYMVLDDLTPVEIPTIEMSGKTILGGAGGVVSCIKDLLPLYKHMLKGAVHQFENSSTATPNNIFRQLPSTMSAHSQVGGPSYHESTYGLGWMRTQLPNTLLKFGTNVGLLGEGPVIGRGADTKLVIAHYGSMPGNFAAVLMYPESESAIVVLTNTTPLCDMTDYITQFLTQTLFDFPEKVDIFSWVKRTVEEELKWYSRLVADRDCKGTNSTDIVNLQQYIGRYWNTTKTLLIEIRTDLESLVISFEGRAEEMWPLTHCRGEVFSWLQPRNKLVSRGRVVLQSAPYYEIRFARAGHGSVNSLFWSHDSMIPGGEEYTKENTK